MALLQCAEPFPLTPTAQAALDRAAELYKPPWSTRNVKGEFDITEKKKKPETEEKKTRIFMPYEVPEPVVRDPRALGEDKTIRHFVPLSDRKWYKTLRDQHYELPARTERTAVQKKRPRRRVPLGGPGQTYVVPLPRRITEQYGPRWRVPPNATLGDLETVRHARRSPSPDSDEDELEPLGFFSASPVGRYEHRQAEKVERRRQAVEEVTETTRKKHTVSQLTGRRRSLSPTYIELMRPVSELIRAPHAHRPPVEVEETVRRSPTPERTRRARSPSPVRSVERSSRSSSSSRFEGSARHFDSTSSSPPPEVRRSALLEAERSYQEVTQAPFSLDHAPRVTVRMRSHRVPTGQDTKFTLNVRARPDGEIAWRHNGVRITPESSKYVFTNTTGVLTIAILDCQAEDSGTYRCTCTNAKGEASDYGTLDVTGGEFTSFSSSRRKDEEAAKAYVPEMTRVDHYHNSHSKAGYSSRTFI